MQKLEQIYEGKAKKVFKTDDPELLIVDYKDDATAFNGLKKGTILGKGVINNQMTNRLMAKMEKAGIPTHFVRELSQRETLVKRVAIVPLEGNHVLMSKEEIENKIATFTGGRAAEEVAFGSVTTGASNDIEQATKLARAMITRYGMSDDFDMVALETVTNQYLGGDASLACSAETQTRIDQQVVALVKLEHQKALDILRENRTKLDELANFLYEKETITGEEFMGILNE